MERLGLYSSRFILYKRRTMKYMYKINKKLLAFVIAAGLFLPHAFPHEAVFRLDPVLDSVLLGSGVALEAAGMSMEHFIDEKNWDGSVRDKDSVNAFDRAFMYKYNKTLDTGCDLMFAVLAAGQLALTFTAEKEEWLPVLAMAAETVMITDGTKRILKKSTGRFRPYTYFDDPASDSDYAESWPSGHAMNGFALASFTSYVFCQYYPDSPWKWAVTGGAFSLAAATAAGRVFSGCHYMSDVLSGAVLGSAIGFLVPFVHRINTKNAKNSTPVSVSVLPSGFSCKIQL